MALTGKLWDPALKVPSRVPNSAGYLETVTLEAGLAEGDVTLLGEELGDKQEAV